MNLIEKVAKRFGYEKASRMAELFRSKFDNVWSSYGEPDQKHYDKMMLGYQNEVWIYACVYLIATTIAGLPWRLYKTKLNKKEGRIEKETAWNQNVYDLFQRPNTNDENSTWFNMIEWTMANLELVGNAYWLLDEVYGSPAKPKSLQNIMPSRMVVVPNPAKGMLVGGYKYITDTGGNILFKPEEITHFKYMSPNSYLYGQGSLSPALWSIDTIKEAQKTNLKIFENGLKIDSFFETDQGLNKSTYDRLMEQIKSKYQGSNKAHQAGILENGLKYKAVTGNLKELEFINGIKLSRQDICAVHGVPPMLVGILDDATYSNYETAVKAFFVFGIIPKLKRISEVISTVVQRFDPSLYFEFDLSNEDALKDDEKKKVEVAKLYFDMGVPFNTINQRLNLGYEDIEGGDIGFLPAGLKPVDMVINPPEPPPLPAMPGAPGQDEESPEEDEDEDEDDKSKSLNSEVYTKEKKLMLWKQFDRVTDLIAKRYMRIIDVYFSGLEKRVLRKLESGKSFEKKINVETILFDEDDEAKQWAKESGKVHKVAMVTNGNRELTNLGMSAVFDVTNPRVVQYLRAYGLDKAKDVTGSLKEDMRSQLISGVDAGEGIPELKKRLQGVFDPYKNEGFKAERVARTEVIGTSNEGALESYRQADVGAKKAWLNEPDARDTHSAAGSRYSESSPIGLDKDFKVGGDSMSAPGGGSLAEENINCRCSIIPVVEE